ncbi:hypothetical protein JCM19232_4327 [Vibrio ishigakensis]|uniref:Uncharacterized protein n=1 Tax=Vibrio ishigakensis TaxID=1481914 RepID=A0A0B8PCP7_9VIBR|nr:hypothetical protein JCM19232_4327 [Vibrio ishigakensis]
MICSSSGAKLVNGPRKFIASNKIPARAIQRCRDALKRAVD